MSGGHETMIYIVFFASKNATKEVIQPKNYGLIYNQKLNKKRLKIWEGSNSPNYLFVSYFQLKFTS